MPPCKHIAKSQEFIYKQVGRGSLGGSRQKYKLVATDIPRNEGSSGAPAEATPMLPPMVSAPSAVNEIESLPDTSYYDNMDDPRLKRTGKVHFIHFHVSVNKNSLPLQRQSDYMRLWLDEKQAKYLKRIIEMKDAPSAQISACPRCGSGRAIWQCNDCTDKNPVCVLCCRNALKLDMFHCVEKWNG